MSLMLIAAVTAAVAASVGYHASRRKDPDGGHGGDDGEKDPPPDPQAMRREQEAGAFEGLPLTLGDVVSAGPDERWLAGALVARERGEVITVLFLAPEGATQGAVAVFAPPRQDIFWLAPTTAESPDEPPATLEIGGVAMRRRGRLPVALERMGQGAPRVGEAGILATYEGDPGEVALVVASEGRIHAWSGRRLEAEQYERLGEGGEG